MSLAFTQSSQSELLASLWKSDRQAKRFADVVKDPRFNFSLLFDFFGDPRHYEQMKQSEIAHDRPALAGVVKELEQLPALQDFFSNNDGHTTFRLRQAVGVLVRLVMGELCVLAGWETTGWDAKGEKGSLGTRVSLAKRMDIPGAYKNARGLATWFVRAERYVKKEIQPVSP